MSAVIDIQTPICSECHKAMVEGGWNEWFCLNPKCSTLDSRPLVFTTCENCQGTGHILKELVPEYAKSTRN